MENDINFNYEPETEVYKSCAATLDGEMFVIGGFQQKRQVNIKKAGQLFTRMIPGLGINNIF